MTVDQQRPFSDETGSAALPVADHLSLLANSAAQFIAQTVPLLSVEGVSKPFEPRIESSASEGSFESSQPTPRSSPSGASEPSDSNSSNGASSGGNGLFAPTPQFTGSSQHQTHQTKSSFNAEPSWAWDRPKAVHQGSHPRPSMDLERDTYDFEV